MSHLTHRARRALFAVYLLAFLPSAPWAASDVAPAPAQQREARMAEAIKAAEASQIKGPQDIPLRDEAVLKLPAGYVWVPEPAAGQLMKAMGNHADQREMGLIFPASDNEHWMIVANYEASGYIKDDDAKNWDVDELFKNLKEGTEAANAERREQGFGELELTGWVEKPNYAPNTHRLIWSMSTRKKGDPADAPKGINYNSYALGREGYITLNLITRLDAVGADKRHAQVLLDALSYNEGKRYADYNASTDKTAEYGLAALVGGLAAKKLGMFALAAGFFAKFAKVILLTGAGLVAAFNKFFKRNKT